MLRAEAGMDAPQMADGAQEQAGADQQHQGQRHLDDDEQTLAVIAGARRAAICGLERTLNVDATTPECGRETKENSGCE